MKLKILLLILTVTIISACGGEEEHPKSHLKFVKSFKLEIPEPSGLAYDYSDSTLWMVSDENSTVYKTDLEGNVISSFEVDGIDLEGITTMQKSYLAVVCERDREVLYLKRDGALYKRKKLSIDGDNENKGLEGIGYSNETHQLYIVNEKKPRVLAIYNDALNEILVDTVNFAKDLSGVCFDDKYGMLWFVSDESRTVYLFNKSLVMIGAFPLDIKQMEGIAFDHNNNLLYLVSDLNEELYVYKLEPLPNMDKEPPAAAAEEEGESEKSSEH